jgi:hypothetical protein
MGAAADAARGVEGMGCTAMDRNGTKLQAGDVELQGKATKKRGAVACDQ